MIPGVCVGLAGAVVLVRVSNLPETWYDLRGVEPLIYTLAAGVAAVVAMIAALAPARRAVRISPMQAMRAE